MRATGLLVPLSLVTAFYVATAFLIWVLLAIFPELRPLLPVGAIDTFYTADAGSFEEILISSATSQAAVNMFTLGIAIVASLLLMVPVSWVYILTHGRKAIQAPMVQTILALPVVVAGISMIVQNNIALAFSLAGIVAAVRFRFSLTRPSHALFIFCAIVVGLAAGIGALEIAIVVSIGFVYAMMVLWKLDYGEHLDGSFLSLFVGRANRE